MLVRIRLQRVICFILFIRAKKVLVLFVSIVSFTAADSDRRGFFGLLFVLRVYCLWVVLLQLHCPILDDESVLLFGCRFKLCLFHFVSLAVEECVGCVFAFFNTGLIEGVDV